MNRQMEQSSSVGRAWQDRLRTLSPRERAELRKKLAARMVGGGALVAEGLLGCGVKRVLGITGTPVDTIFAECAVRGIQLVGTRHQQSAVLMAAAANYLAGRLESVVVVSAGPAATNALTGVLVARDNGWPVIVLAGRRPVHREGIGYFQELDAVPIFAPLTKWAAKVDRTSQIMGAVIAAFEIACQGRPGPVYLDLPEDVLEGTAAVDGSAKPVCESRRQAEPDQVAMAAQILGAAERPLMILGEGIRWSFNPSALQRLAGEFGIPFITSPMGRGFLSDDHPLCANDARHWIQSQADVVLMAGAWFDWRFRFGGELAQGARIIHADIDPQTLGRNVEPALSVWADSGRFLSQLAEALDAAFQPNARKRLEAWHACVQEDCRRHRQARTVQFSRESKPLAPHQLFREIGGFLPPDAIIVLDGGVTLATGQALLSARSPCGWLDPGWNGCMGVGIPFGLGAKLARPERMVVVICGDYGFGLTAMDLETAVRCKIPVIVVIVNNGGINGATRQKRYLPPDYAHGFSQFQPALRYEEIMRAFGGHAQWATEAGEIRPALERAAASGLPACINVWVDPDAPHPGTW
jgi:thiamine pyrophosphate-dependent acetolactate synthase large subunit-like protein